MILYILVYDNFTDAQKKKTPSCVAFLFATYNGIE